jgi:hypothetical protein
MNVSGGESDICNRGKQREQRYGDAIIDQLSIEQEATEKTGGVNSLNELSLFTLLSPVHFSFAAYADLCLSFPVSRVADALVLWLKERRQQGVGM